jgi:hypothetical protein
MLFDFYTQFGALNSAPVFQSFREGLLRHGHQATTMSKKADAAVIWSVLWHGRMKTNQSIFNHYRIYNKPVIVLEIGSLIRDKTWKIGVNGINQGSFFMPNGQDDSRKRRLGLTLKPWNRSGNKILICGQHELSHQWKDQPPMKQWILDTVNTLKTHTDRPIEFRSHPRYPVSVNGVKQTSIKDFTQDLSESWAVVNYNSGPGVTASIEGIPAFVDKSSLAAPLGNIDLSRIETPEMINRDQWMNDLAWTEWTTEEMSAGIPHEYLLHYLQFSNITGS